MRRRDEARGGAVVVIAGPTASGKSRLAQAIAEAFDGVVINADSMQVYRELRILSGRPDAAALARVPHRLYGALPASERCSAGRWRTMAEAEIEAAQGAGRLPIVAGGTGLYIKALMAGLAPIPEIPPAARRAARARLSRQGGEAMLAELARRDPETAARLAAGDSQRLVRAWEVLEATGQGLSEWQQGPPAGGAMGRPQRGGGSFLTLLLDPPRQALYAACDARFDEMLSAGAVAEVRALDALGLDPELPAMKALGVPELRRHLGGELTLDEATRRAKQATRNYAKRQRTWFRHQLTPSRVISAQFSERVDDEIFPYIRQFMLTAQA